MSKKPRLTAEAVFALYTQLDRKQLARFASLQALGYAACDLQAAKGVVELYDHLSDEEQAQFRERSGWNASLADARDESVRRALRTAALILRMVKRKEEEQRRRRHAEPTYRQWRDWHDTEGLTHGQIRQRIFDMTGEWVPENTIAKGIQRLNQREQRKPRRR